MLEQYNPHSPTSISVSVSQHMFDPYNEKVNPAHLYVRQPHTIQIIQLVEGPPPPPRISSVIHSSSAGSSSGSSYPSTSDSEDDNCSSYCSSYVTHPDSSQDKEPVVWTDDTYNVRMKRVNDWRDNFLKATSSSAEPRSSPLKRKSQMDDDESVSHSPKRSRSRDPQNPSRLLGHSCIACDTPFSSRQSLRQHGCTPHVSEACRTAVAYDFE